MKALVVYHSHTGNTRRVALQIAKHLDCDTEEIKDTADRSGKLGYLKAGRDAMTRRLTKIRLIQHDPKAYDLIVVGTPIWGWNMTPAVRTYLTQNSGLFKKLAFYCTMGGSGDSKAFKEMQALCRKAPLQTLTLVDKKIDDTESKIKIKTYAENIRKKMQ